MYKKFLLIISFSIIINIGNASEWKIRLVENSLGYMELQMKCINGTLTPSYGSDISELTFQIYWPTSLNADIDLVCLSNAYSIVDNIGSLQTTGANNWREYSINGAPIACPSTWVVDVWETITTFKVVLGSGASNFTVANDGELGSGLIWEYGTPSPIIYNPDVDGSISGYSYPTNIYTHVWTGGIVSANSVYKTWERSGNWENECGDAVTNYPFETDNTYIPSVSSTTGNYPEITSDIGWACKDLRIASGASVSVPNLTAATDQNYFWIDGNCIIDGALNISPGSYVTINGSSAINTATGIVVEADATGIGSLIDNGTINYGGSGTAKVQTYLSNSAGVGNYDIHLIGPTVDEENYTGAGTGSFLDAFNVLNNDTWIYNWDETANVANGWVNIYLINDEIHTCEGIGISTTNNTDYTLDMTGEFITGTVTSTLTYSNNHIELISNPYASPVDFDALAATNSGVILNKYWIYDPAANNYVTRASGSGGSKYIQVGQGLFVETYQDGAFTFSNAQRVHSNDPFRASASNVLTVEVTGGQEEYKDELIIRFDKDASNGYDIEIESIKWYSQNEDATMISSLIDENIELAINVLPLENLSVAITSVPMYFYCGYNTEYTLSFSDIETFDVGTKIWLEDKLVGGDWILINNNTDYVYSANTDEPVDRFVIHFLGPAGLDEPILKRTIEIYSYQQFVYVRNNTNEVIKEVQIYNLSGKQMHGIEYADIKLNKILMSSCLDYYVVQVITNKNVYTKKVLVTK